DRLCLRSGGCHGRYPPGNPGRVPRGRRRRPAVRGVRTHAFGDLNRDANIIGELIMTTHEMIYLYGRHWAAKEQAMTAAQLHRSVVIAEIAAKLRERAIR